MGVAEEWYRLREREACSSSTINGNPCPSLKVQTPKGETAQVRGSVRRESQKSSATRSELAVGPCPSPRNHSTRNTLRVTSTPDEIAYNHERNAPGISPNRK